jgi:predicted membrane channel-forming protein YqfA (hemolysin III family)
MLIAGTKSACKGTTMFGCLNFLFLLAFELMWLTAIGGVIFRMSREGSVCAGDYEAEYN